MQISIIGAGTWGTALARLASLNGHSVRLWAHEPEVVDSIRNRGVNSLFLTGVELPREIQVTGDAAEAVRGAEMVLTAVPSQHLRRVLEKLSPHVPPHVLFVSATKGLEEGTCLRMSEVVGEVFSPTALRIVVLSGPTFATEVADDQPSALVAAGTERDATEKVQSELSTRCFRIYTNDDVVGVELGGAVKNVIAIAAGVAAGLGLSHNSMAALVTRGLVEISRLCVALGGKRETLSGLAGLGDLVLTCTGRSSRNRALGFQLGRGEPLDAILTSMRMIAEGVPTTRATVHMARSHGVEMPITFQMDRLLRGETAPEQAMHELMCRPLKVE